MSNVSSDEVLKRPLSQVGNGSIKKNRSNSDTDRSRSGMSKDTSAIVADGQAEDGDGSEAETVVMPGKELDPRASAKKTIRHESNRGPVSAIAEPVKSDGLTNGLQMRTRTEGGNGSDRKADKPNNTTESQHSPAGASPSHVISKHRSRSRAASESSRMKEDHNESTRSGTSRKRKGSMDGLEDKSVKRRIKREDTETAEHRKPSNHGRSESPTRQQGSTSSNPNSVQKAKRKVPTPLVVSAGSKGKDHADGDSNESQSPRRSAPPRVTHYAEMTKRRDKNGRTRVARACALNNLFELREWLEDHPEELDEADNAGNTPLQIASLQGETEIVRHLLKKGAKFDTENCDKDSPLIDAVENSHIDVIRMLLEAGVNPRKLNAKGEEAADLVDMEHINGPAVKEELAKYRIKYDSKRRKSTEKAPDTSRDSVATRSPRDSPSTTRSPPPQATRRRAGRSEATRNDLLWTTATPENLVNFAGKGDDQAIMHLLNMRPISDVEAVFAAAKGGHDSCLNLLLALGRTDQDPAPLEDQKKGYNTPMLVAIGKGNVRVIELLLEQPDFDPTRRMHKNMTYYEIAEKRQGEAWREEHRMLKAAYDERIARDGKKGVSKSSRTSSPKDSKKAARERSPSTIARDTSPSTAKNGLLRKKPANLEHDNSKPERGQEKARLGHAEKKSDRKHLKVPKHESREGSAATSDREPSPMRDKDRRSASDQELAPRPRKRLVSGKDLRDAQNKQRRNSLVSVKSVGSAQELTKSKSHSEDIVKSKHRDLDARKEKKRTRKSVSPQPSDTARSPASTIKRHKNNADSGASKPSAGPSKVSASTRPSQGTGSAPVALMGSPSLGKKDLKSSSKETTHTAPEARVLSSESSEKPKLKHRERSSKLSSSKVESDVPKTKDSNSNPTEHLSIQEDTKHLSPEAPSSVVKHEEIATDTAQEPVDLPVISQLAPEDHQAQPTSASVAPDIEMHSPTEMSSLGKRSFSEMEKDIEQPEQVEQPQQLEQPEQLEQSEEPEQTVAASAIAEPALPTTTVPEQDVMIEIEQSDHEQRNQKQAEEDQIAAEEAHAQEAAEQLELLKKQKRAVYLSTLPKSIQNILKAPAWAKKKEQLEKWLPLVCAPGFDVDPDCPESERNELWLSNYQAAAILVDAGLSHSYYPSWIHKPMVGAAKSIAWRFTNHYVHQFYYQDAKDPTKAVAEGVAELRSCKAKWEAMDLFWIRLSDFQSAIPNYEHLNGIELPHIIQQSVKDHEDILRGIEESRARSSQKAPSHWRALFGKADKKEPANETSQPPPS